MRSLKYLLSVLAGVIIYVLISITCGSSGILATKELENQRRQISINTQNITNLNEGLKLEKTAIQSDMDVIASYAHKLGYVFEGEKLVKISGLKKIPDIKYDTGAILKSKEIHAFPESFCKVSGMLVGILVFFVMFIYDISKGNISFTKKEYETISGIPVYDIKQI